MADELQHVSRLVKFSVFVGIFAIRILDGIPWVWGNLGVYVTSYYYYRVDKSTSELTTWLMSVDIIAFNIALLVGNPISKKFGVLKTLLVCILVYNAAICLSYYTINHSLAAFCFTFGIVTGLAGGVIEACQLKLIVRWTERLHGLSASSVPSSNILGAVVVNFMLTFFINPYNEEPETSAYRTKIFTNDELLDRVPYSFILLGGVSFAVNIFGFFLIRIKPGKKNVCLESVEKWRYYVSGERVRLIEPDSETQRSKEIELVDSSLQEDPHSNEVNEDSSNDGFTPRQVLKLREFYVLWGFVAVQTYAFFVLNTYYKEFGLIYIPDDHFLTAVVMVKCLVTPVCTWIAGYAVDRFGAKITVVVTSSVFGVIASLFYLTTFNKWMYLISCVTYGCSLFTLFCLTSACCVKLFGETHFTTIFGMVLTSTYITTGTLPLIGGWIISTYGWLTLFSSVGLLALTNVILLIWGLPEKNSSI